MGWTNAAQVVCERTTVSEQPQARAVLDQFLRFILGKCLWAITEALNELVPKSFNFSEVRIAMSDDCNLILTHHIHG
jgi:hypothetical protein